VREGGSEGWRQGRRNAVRKGGRQGKREAVRKEGRKIKHSYNININK